MKCPLLSIASLTPYEGQVDPPLDCLKEKCAWFHPITQSCEVSRIASNLSSITHELDQLTKELTLVMRKTVGLDFGGIERRRKDDNWRAR